MSITTFTLFSLYLSTLSDTFSNALPDHPTPYLSPVTFFPNYQNMLNTFKIFIYEPNTTFAYDSPTQSLFHASLRNSPFATQNAEQAHLFFIPFPSDLSRVVRGLRKSFPYWNRTLGADHVYVSCDDKTTTDSDRNILELRKNSIQISCFPTSSGKFIPHKDITLPPLSVGEGMTIGRSSNATQSFLGYFRYDGGGEEVSQSALAKQMADDPDFLVDFEPSNEISFTERASTSKFCLFEYGSDMSRIGEALGLGCVPVVMTDRPIKDLPFTDVVRWQEIAMFVAIGRGVDELKHVLGRTSGELYARMRGMGVSVSKHFVWHVSPEPYDCFNTLIYQLWLRRHTIRYVLRD
ncbi:probable glycosyltransferase At5g20260 [Humulus lupulus]|uniref:probable glycosyltransferase At5g20260 n=1 Tax=Humulus lupulus TaxID=3486 RepID=UPI002B40179A|nr:probable glycosyltransferase At5g20260 [Humulus lupulus]